MGVLSLPRPPEGGARGVACVALAVLTLAAALILSWYNGRVITWNRARLMIYRYRVLAFQR